MERAQKATLIKSVSEQFKKSKAAILVDFKGMTVEQTFKLRKQLKGAQADIRVVRNTLAIRALAENPDKEAALKDAFVGTNAVVFVNGDISAAAKVLSDCAKDVEQLQIKTGVMDGKKLAEAQIKYLASLPPMPVLRAQFLGTLSAAMSGFVRLLAAKKDKDEGKN